MQLKGSEILVECLKRESVDTIFCYIGGAVIPIFDALYRTGANIKRITPRHEQAAAHAADGYARSTGKPGVVLVTSGPGATNTITGIATAYMDSVPMVIITGQVPSGNIGTDAFQESDITGMTMPITKANFRIRSIDMISTVIKKAFSISMTGRKGPVLVDIPVDIQKAEGKPVFTENNNNLNRDTCPKITDKKLKKILQLINHAQKPLILAGGGVISSNSCRELNKLSLDAGIPIVNTLMGYGCCGKENRGYFGGIGMHGSIYGNYAILNCDLLIALGTRFSDRIIGDPKTFAPNAKILHVDIDPSELGKNIIPDISLATSVKKFIKSISMEIETGNYSEWISEIESVKKKYPLTFNPGERIKPQSVISKCSEIFDEDTIVVTDVGQHQMWVPQFFPVAKPHHFLTSGGLGTMGYALPAAIGAKIGNPQKEVLMFSGDGGFQMNIQELVTLIKYRINLKMVILDNGYLGMVRQWQQLMCAGRYAETDMNDNPDFVRIATAYGIDAEHLSEPEECNQKLVNLRDHNGPKLLHVKVEREENVLPMVPPGRSLEESILEIKLPQKGVDYEYNRKK